ncbi:hypothetical protein JCM18901_1436 [Psychrobacter sp. JCM 18901]|nr:hypothetical protein JCM18901_1436 [Psychrobacter sp. JCM 18901]
MHRIDSIYGVKFLLYLFWKGLFVIRIIEHLSLLLIARLTDRKIYLYRQTENNTNE